MPLVRTEVRNEFALGAPQLYRDAKKEEPKDILEGVAVAGLVGLLRQLGDLADFAAEIFHGFQEEVTITTARSHKLMNRVRRIEAAISPLEKALLAQRSHLHFAYTAGSNWHTRIRCEQNQFVYSDVPQCIMESYEDCRHPPCLHMLDRFDPGGPGSCLKRYSDPTFFRSASVASGEASADKISKEKKKGRKTKKRRSWPKNGAMSRDPSFSYNSGRMPFTQRSIVGHISPSQTAATYDATLRLDFGEQSNLDLRYGSSYIEVDFRPSYSVEPESRDSISSAVKKHENDCLDYSFIGEKATDAYDDIGVGTNLDLRNGASNIEGDFRPSYSVESESRDSISSAVKKHGNDYLDYSFVMEKARNAYDDIDVVTQEQAGCSSSSFTWDEKRESSEPALQESETDGMAEEDIHNRHLESISLNLGMGSPGYKGSDFVTADKMVLPFCKEAVPEPESGDVRLDDIESETDNFMDALNTIESESETDIDSTMKQVVEHHYQLEEKGEDDGACEHIRPNLECHSSSPKSNILAMSPLINGNHSPHGHNINSMPRNSSYATGPINDSSPKGDLNSVLLMNKDLQSSQKTGDSVSPGRPKSSDSRGNNTIDSGEYAPPTVSSNFGDRRPLPVTVGTRESPESKNPGVFELRRQNLELQSSSPEFNVTANSPVINGSDGHTSISSPEPPNITYGFTEEVSCNDDNSISLLNKDLQSSQRTGDPASPGCLERSDSHENSNTAAGICVESVASTEASNLEDVRPGLFSNGMRKSPESHEHVGEISNVTPVTFWTNGGLLGLQPSKPPECSVLNALSQDPECNKNGKTNSSIQHFSISDKDLGQQNHPDSSISNIEDLDMNMSSHEYQESGFRRASWKISPADLEINLGKLGGGFMPVNASHQEKSRSSSGIFGFSDRLLSTGSSEKSLPGADGNIHSAGYNNTNDSELKNRRSVEHRSFSGRSKDPFGGKSPLLSPSQSPPLEHMKISFQPINGFESSKLKLKFPDGKTNNDSGSDIYPSFQLVPEGSIPQYSVVSDSDADKFCRSSPSLSDDCHSNQSESNSEKWESSESPTSKDRDLYDALRRISLTESASALPENGRENQDHIHGNLGLQFPFIESGVQNSESCRSFDHQSSSTINNSFRKELRNDADPKNHVEPRPLPSTPLQPLPPSEWRGMLPHIGDKPEAMPGGSYYVGLGFARSASAISQPKPAPFSEDQIDVPNMQKSKPNPRKLNVRGETSQSKSTDENDFLHQIRTKSFNLRPTVTTRPTVPSGAPATVEVNAILEKANAIRQAVASDADDDGNWSDP